MIRATLTLTGYEPDTGLHTGTILVDGRPMRVWLPEHAVPDDDAADDFTGAAIGADEDAHDPAPF